MEKKQRAFGLDLIRSLAVLLVLTTHMFTYTKVLNHSIRSVGWVAYDALHYFAIICVPLFLLLTGFLQNKKQVNAKHYTSIIPVLLSYFSISLVTVALTALAHLIEKGKVGRTVLHVFDFTYGYSWYVEMYICLFLLIPFLNILFDALDRKKQQIMIVILFCTTMLPALVANFIVDGIWFEVIPDFFDTMYVLVYYFIGSYIAKYRPQPKRIYCILAILVVVAAETTTCFAFSSEKYAWWVANKFSAPSHMVIAVAVFLLLYQVDCRYRPIRWIIQEISVCSFEMYLISYGTDHIVYRYLSGLPSLCIVACNFVLVYILARIIRLILVPVGKKLRSLKIFLPKEKA